MSPVPRHGQEHLPGPQGRPAAPGPYRSSGAAGRRHEGRGGALGARRRASRNAPEELALAHLQDGASGGVSAHGEGGVRDAQVPQLAIHAAAHGPRDADVQLLPRLGEQVRRVLAARPGAAPVYTSSHGRGAVYSLRAPGRPSDRHWEILSSCGPATSDDTVAPRTARAPVPNSTATTAMRVLAQRGPRRGPAGPAARRPTQSTAPNRTHHTVAVRMKAARCTHHQPPLTGATRAVRRTARTATTAPATRPHGGLGRAAPGASGSSRGADRPTGQRPAAMSVR